MLIASGVVTAINMNLALLVPENEKVLVFTPVYDPFYAAKLNSRHTLVTCPMVNENCKYHVDFDLFENELKNGVKAMILCNPHNPVGKVWTYDEMKKITADFESR